MKSLVVVCEVLEGNVALCLKKIVNLQIEFYEEYLQLCYIVRLGGSKVVFCLQC